MLMLFNKQLGEVKIDGCGRVAMVRDRTTKVATFVKDFSSNELAITNQDFMVVFKGGV